MATHGPPGRFLQWPPLQPAVETQTKGEVGHADARGDRMQQPQGLLDRVERLRRRGMGGHGTGSVEASLARTAAAAAGSSSMNQWPAGTRRTVGRVVEPA